MLNLNSIMIGSNDPRALSEFYEKVLEKSPDWAGDGWYGWQTKNCNFNIGEHSEIKGKAREPQRVILNFETKEVKAEFERIKGLGAEVIKKPYALTQEGEPTDDENAMWIATFADPDGNYFQLMSPWKNN